jgi:hypothetical protein
MEGNLCDRCKRKAVVLSPAELKAIKWLIENEPERDSEVPEDFLTRNGDEP